jgi:glucuronoarabinoxylan endo-1,4-beta-xylanase
MDFPRLENGLYPRELWMTEVYVPNSNHDADLWPEAVDVAVNIHNALVVGGMNAYVWWYIRRSYGPMKENGNISKRGYMMAHFSKFVRPGSVRVSATEFPANNVYVSAYKNSDGKLVVVAINHSDNSYAQQFTVSGKTVKNVTRYRTSSSENLAVTNNLALTGNGWWAQLNAKTVSTFVVS